jgi:hypothetical protein
VLLVKNDGQRRRWISYRGKRTEFYWGTEPSTGVFRAWHYGRQK